MDLFEDNRWYEAELARSGRSKCKEFRCKETINEGELRIGIKTEEHDHGGDSLGWYHPKCLWKTFCYKSNANPRIKRIEDIVNYRTLEEDEVEVLNALIKKTASATEATVDVSVTSPIVAGAKRVYDAIFGSPTVSNGKGSVTLSIAGDDLMVSGDTFAVKDVLKAAGGRWNGANKSWMFSEVNHATILSLFDLAEMLTPGQTKTVDTSALLAAAGSTSSSTSSSTAPLRPAPPKYAMAGTIVFTLDNTTQDINIRGNFEHIAGRLRAAGAVLQTGFYTVAEYFKFSTQSRAGARKFLCMPDDLPPAGVDIEIDLAELGRKQAAADGATISAEEQQAAEHILRLELERQDAKVLEEARAALTALGWGQPVGAELGGRSKRARRGQQEEPAGDNAAVEIPHPLPKNVDELCYEARLNLSPFTISDFKARLAARGLPVSGPRDALEARFLQAGAEYAPIKDLAEYTRLAKGRRLQLKYVIPTRAGDLIDTLLARCQN